MCVLLSLHGLCVSSPFPFQFSHAHPKTNRLRQNSVQGSSEKEKIILIIIIIIIIIIFMVLQLLILMICLPPFKKIPFFYARVPISKLFKLCFKYFLTELCKSTRIVQTRAGYQSINQSICLLYTSDAADE